MLSTYRRRIASIAAVCTLCSAVLTATGNAATAPRVLAKAPSWSLGASAGAPRAAASGGEFIPYAPTRLLDTRGSAPLGPGQHGKLHFDPKSLPANAIAVTFNLTGIDPSAGTYLAVQPGSGMPAVSNLNLRDHETRANQVTVPLSADGSVDIFNKNGFTNVIADLSGFYVSAGDSAVDYAPISPTRLVDTRNLGHIASGQTIAIDLHGKVPDNATAVTVNVTGVGASNNTFLSLYPSETQRPLASTLNLIAGETTPNLATVTIGSDRKILLYNNYGVADAAVDLFGYYAPDGPTRYVPLSAPKRIVDSRVDGVPLPGDGARDINADLPGSDLPVSVLVNITGVNDTRLPTFLTAWGTSDRPYTSNVNLAGLQTASNAANVPVSAAGYFNLYNAFGAIDDVVDLQGYFVTR